ncbi:MAG: hypothetical protein R6V49_09000, partial [Bacteroidales bacterium]
FADPFYDSALFCGNNRIGRFAEENRTPCQVHSDYHSDYPYILNIQRIAFTCAYIYFDIRSFHRESCGIEAFPLGYEILSGGARQGSGKI